MQIHTINLETLWREYLYTVKDIETHSFELKILRFLLEAKAIKYMLKRNLYKILKISEFFLIILILLSKDLGQQF